MSVDAESRLALDILPGDHGDVLFEGTDVDDGMKECHALFQWTNVDEIGEDVGLAICQLMS